MLPDRRRTTAILRGIIYEIRVERVTFMAGSVAYNAFLSLLPLLFLLLALVSSIGSETLEGSLVSITQTIITPGAGDIIIQELRQATVSISILGVLILGWGALRIFRSLDMAFSDIYESQAENTLVNQLTDGITVLVSLTAVVVLVLLVETRIPVETGATVGWFLQRGVLFAVLCVALFPMFYLFPDESDMQYIEAVPGVIVTALGLLVLQSFFGLYLTFSDPQVQNSVLASLIVFLTWLYFNALVILIGAVINAVLTNRSAQIQLEPVIGDNSLADPAAREEYGIPRATIIHLSEVLPTARSVEITVGDDRFVLPPPERIDVDENTSRLPFINNTAHITLHWTPKQG